MFHLLKPYRAAHRPTAGIALIDLLIFVILALFISGLIAALRHYSPTVRNPYPPAVGQSYPEDAKPTVLQKQWTLTTTSLLTEINRRSHFILTEYTATNSDEVASLRKWWNINNRHDLLKTLQWIEEGGHRKSYDDCVKTLREHGQLTPPPETFYAVDVSMIPNRQERTLAVVRIIHARFDKKGLVGWDFSRYVSLCRWGAHAGYLTEEEAWKKIMPAARLLQSTFQSWEELAYNYRLGRLYWSPMKDETKLINAQDKLRTAYYSPWAGLPWQTNLLPSQQQDDGQEEYVIGRAWEDAFGNERTPESWDEHRKEAFKWFLKSAEKDNASGMYFLAHCYYWGLGCPADRKLYQTWIQKAVAKGDPWSHYQWGLSCYRDRTENIKPKQIADLIAFSVTNNGCPAAVAMQGWMYETGYGGTKKDPQKALSLFFQAAQTEDPYAMLNIVNAYQKGICVEKSQTEVARWLRRAALNGDRQSMFEYAECLRKGDGIATNTVEALTWYHQAATNNESRAIKYLKKLEAK